MRYLAYEASRDVPNVVVDGSPNESTVLTLTHWPGFSAPPGLARDLSAEMAFAYLDDPADHAPADVVTNNHFDQDGLVAIHALVDPERSLEHRELLIDVAAAGDFATFHDRRAARASMALARLAEREAPAGYAALADDLYRELLPELLPIALDNDRFRDLWAEEDARLDASEAAIASGRVTIVERPDLDLAIVTIDENEPPRSGHRFGHAEFDAVHPMALHAATERFRLLVVHGRQYRYVDRYETWVQYQSRPTLPRIDLRPLADALTAAEHGDVSWHADPPGALTPELRHDGESTIDPTDLVAHVVRALTAP
jgi:hypothetical protein